MLNFLEFLMHADPYHCQDYTSRLPCQTTSLPVTAPPHHRGARPGEHRRRTYTGKPYTAALDSTPAHELTHDLQSIPEHNYDGNLNGVPFEPADKDFIMYGANRNRLAPIKWANDDVQDPNNPKSSDITNLNPASKWSVERK